MSRVPLSRKQLYFSVKKDKFMRRIQRKQGLIYSEDKIQRVFDEKLGSV
jgi:hypothetical protein